MSDIQIGLQFIVTGMVIVFITLTVMSFAMWLVGNLVKEKKKEERKTEGFDDDELLAVSVAIHQYRTEKQETELRFKPVSNWKIQGRIESLERNP